MIDMFFCLLFRKREQWLPEKFHTTLTRYEALSHPDVLRFRDPYLLAEMK